MKNSNKDTLLARWLTDDLTSKEAQDFKASEAYQSYEKISAYANQLETPPYDTAKAWDAISDQTIHKVKVRPLYYKWATGIAASIVLLFGMFYGLNVGTTTYQSDFGAQLSVVLPDGSEAILNANSEIEFNKTDWENEKRTLELDGEAYFKVKKGSLFMVKTSKGTVEVLGTQFNVNSFANTLEVKCYTGKVRVSDATNKAILTTGNAYRIIDTVEENWTFKTTDNSWLNNENTFYNTPLSNVFVSLENQFKISIENKNSYLNQRFTGSFFNDDKNLALKTVLEAMNISYVFNKNNVILAAN